MHVESRDALADLIHRATLAGVGGICAGGIYCTGGCTVGLCSRIGPNSDLSTARSGRAECRAGVLVLVALPVDALDYPDPPAGEPDPPVPVDVSGEGPGARSIDAFHRALRAVVAAGQRFGTWAVTFVYSFGVRHER